MNNLFNIFFRLESYTLPNPTLTWTNLLTNLQSIIHGRLPQPQKNVLQVHVIVNTCQILMDISITNFFIGMMSLCAGRPMTSRGVQTKDLLSVSSGIATKVECLALAEQLGLASARLMSGEAPLRTCKTLHLTSCSSGRQRKQRLQQTWFFSKLFLLSTAGI